MRQLPPAWLPTARMNSFFGRALTVSSDCESVSIMAVSTGVRAAQREATRARLLSAAVECLLERGYCATTTLAVQNQAQVARGALLHHFPTRAQLFGALVEHLVASNEAAVLEALHSEPNPDDVDHVRRSVGVLFAALSRPAFQAELELWAAARTDAELRSALRQAEGGARRELARVVDTVFGPDLVARAGYAAAAELTVTLLRGLVVSLPLRENTSDLQSFLDTWASTLRHLLDAPGDMSSPDSEHQTEEL